MYKGLLYHGLNQIAKAQENQEKWKKRILEQYEETKKMPWKKKKCIRKELRLDWIFANYNLFDL